VVRGGRVEVVIDEGVSPFGCWDVRGAMVEPSSLFVDGD